MLFRTAQTSTAFGAGSKLAFELIAIFLGVYAAFWVDNYREELAEEQRGRNIAESIQRGLDDVISFESGIIEKSLDGLAEWESSRQRGESPPPFYFRITGSERAPHTVFEAIIQSRPAELFDSELMFDLGYFYSELSGVGDRYVRYATFTEREVLPSLKTGSASFYDLDGESLLPKYAAHMDRLREFTKFWSDDVQRAEELKERLAKYVE